MTKYIFFEFRLVIFYSSVYILIRKKYSKANKFSKLNFIIVIEYLITNFK